MKLLIDYHCAKYAEESEKKNIYIHRWKHLDLTVIVDVKLVPGDIRIEAKPYNQVYRAGS